MNTNIVDGFNVSCVGDDVAYSYLQSRLGNTPSDHVALHVLKRLAPDFKSYQWKGRRSDEPHCCAHHDNPPISSVMRIKYGEYPEYHASLDRLVEVVTEVGMVLTLL